MSDIKLTAAKLRVVVGDVDNPDSWREFTVQTSNREQLLAEELMAREKLGLANERQITFLTALAYFALQRTHQLDAPNFASFREACLDIDVVEQQAVGPTPPAAEAG